MVPRLAHPQPGPGEDVLGAFDQGDVATALEVRLEVRQQTLQRRAGVDRSAQVGLALAQRVDQAAVRAFRGSGQPAAGLLVAQAAGGHQQLLIRCCLVARSPASPSLSRS